MADPSLKTRRWRWVIAIILLLGGALRTLQYVSGGSLWIDELSMALNVEGRSLEACLGQPLDFHQAAPPAFVAAIKVLTSLFGTDESGFRAIPWLSSLAALVLFWCAARRFLQGAWLAAALLPVATSPALIWFGGNVKPYAGDVAIGMTLVLLAMGHRDRAEAVGPALRSGGLGALVIPFSFPAITTAAALGCLLGAEWARRPARSSARALAALLVPWAASAAGSAWWARALTTEATQAYMGRFWSQGFMPAPWSAPRAWLWLPDQLQQALGNFLFWYMSARPAVAALLLLCSALTVFGLVVLVRRDPRLAALLMAPVLAAVVMAGAQLLPFSGRVALYTGWPMLICMMFGLQYLGRSASWLARWPGRILAGGMALAPSLCLLWIEAPPYRSEETKPVLRTLAARARHGDAFAAYYGAERAVAFYGPRTGLTDWSTGACHRDDPRAYFRELDVFRGRPRVWVLFTHSALGYREPEVIHAYLSAIGTERDHIPDPYGHEGQEAAFAYLFDLSEPARLGLTDAARFEFGDVRTGGMRVLCDGTHEN